MEAGEVGVVVDEASAPAVSYSNGGGKILRVLAGFAFSLQVSIPPHSSPSLLHQMRDFNNHFQVTRSQAAPGHSERVCGSRL